MNEEEIHKRMQQAQHHNMQQRQNIQERFDRSHKTSRKNLTDGDYDFPRYNFQSFRSNYFNVGEGVTTVPKNTTVILAKLSIPLGFSGVLKEIRQFHEAANPNTSNSITWALRINGNPVNNFTDWVGAMSTLAIPLQLNIPLIGSGTIGGVFLSPGSTAEGQNQTPNLTLSATNNNNNAQVLQARLVGWVFPLDERNDEFRNF